MKTTRRTAVFVAMACALCVFPAFARDADTVSVQNNVSASSSTGGNAVSSGGVTQGKSESSVYIQTTVNGEVVQEVNETKSSEDGLPVSIEKELYYESSSSQISEENVGGQAQAVIAAETSVEASNAQDDQEPTREVVAEPVPAAKPNLAASLAVPSAVAVFAIISIALYVLKLFF